MYSLRERFEHFKTGFIGKPDESALNDYGFQLSDKYISYSLPSNNQYNQYNINIPILNLDFFKSKSEHKKYEEYIDISSNIYLFGKVIKNILSLYNSLGHLFFVITLKHFKDVDCTDLSSLSNEIYSKHFEYHNEIDEDNPFKGEHKRNMQEAEEYAQLRWTPYDGRELTNQEKKERDDFIDRSYHTSNPPLTMKIKPLGENHFVFYSEETLKYSSTTKHFYCLPINEDFYLSFEFWYRVEKGNWNKKFKDWINNTKGLEETIIKTIKISNIVNSDLEQISDNT